ncbi:MAG: phytanoyl-CoA dioxygenase family protein, partial [Nannocystaceae bacterium]
MNPRTPLSREHVEQFNRDGFVVVKGLLSSPEYEVLQSFCTSGSDLGKLQTKVRDTGTRTYKVAIWTTLDGSLFGKLPRLPRVVFGIQQLLGEPVYHWHSKVLRKQPGDGSVGIHQDYATWYEDG